VLVLNVLVPESVRMARYAYSLGRGSGQRVFPEYSRSLSSHWSHVDNILRIFSVPVLPLVTCRPLRVSARRSVPRISSEDATHAASRIPENSLNVHYMFTHQLQALRVSARRSVPKVSSEGAICAASRVLESSRNSVRVGYQVRPGSAYVQM
jgi:hypothetical protein